MVEIGLGSNQAGGEGGDGEVVISGECLFGRSVAFQESGANQREGTRGDGPCFDAVRPGERAVGGPWGLKDQVSRTSEL
jgi:hypothetical protein